MHSVSRSSSRKKTRGKKEEGSSSFSGKPETLESRPSTTELSFSNLGESGKLKIKPIETDATIFSRLASIDHRATEYNVATVKANKKFLKVLENTARSKISDAMLNGVARKERRLQKTNELLASKIGEYLEQRLMASDLSRQARFVRLGDEYRLRATVMHDGININQRERSSGRTLICEAAAYGQYSIARYLCAELRVDVNKVTMIGSITPLHMAVQAGYRQICSLLITYGAKVDATDRYGNTPMHLLKKRTILKLLVKSEASPLIKNKAGDNALEAYIKNTLSEMPMSGMIDGRAVAPEDIRNGDILRELGKYTESCEKEKLRQDQAMARAFEEEFAQMGTHMRNVANEQQSQQLSLATSEQRMTLMSPGLR